MSLQSFAIDRPTFTWFIAFMIAVAGVGSYFKLGQLEDPDFSVKTAIVMVTYPGASAEEVEQEVTNEIELQLQRLPELDSLQSYSRAGSARIKVNIKPIYGTGALPQIWDKVRARVSDARLPPGAGPPLVIDDFGNVFGLLLALTGDGYSYAEMEAFAKDVKRELTLVEGVARVDLWGVQERRVYLDVRNNQLAQLGISDITIAQTLETQNVVVDAGQADSSQSRLRVAPTGTFTSPEDIEILAIRPALFDSIQADSVLLSGVSNEILTIGDIGTVRSGYLDPPASLMRFNEIPAIALAITNRPGANVVAVGRAVDARVDELIDELPIGIELEKVHWQSDVIDESVQGFFINLIEAIVIVLLVLTLPMGWRMGTVIGTALILTVAATFALMAVFGIDLQRMSLGALVIALGMMVDNAIVVADGYVVRMGKGMKRRDAAVEAASSPSMPLLGATVIAVMAFYPIFASDENAGEYCATLFSVVAIALMVSWLVSVTITPLQCMQMLKAPEESGGDPYGGRFFSIFRGVLETAIRFRFVTIGGAVILLVAAFGSFGGVTKLFFPDSTMTKFMVDYWAQEGTQIETVSANLAEIEAHLLADERVADVATFVGAGPPRFYLPVEPEPQNPAYGQLIVNVRDFDEIDGLIADLDPWIAETFPTALVPLRKFGVGPGDTWKFELRISGPSDADSDVLRDLADKVMAIVRASPYAGLIQTDMRQRVVQLEPEFSQTRARWANVTREDVARTIKRTLDGIQVGLYREGDDLIPIVMRAAENERGRISTLTTLPVRSPLSTSTIPLAQVLDGIETSLVDPVIPRYDRRRIITVQANASLGYTFPTLFDDISAEIEALEMPPGYRMEWGGEFENSTKSQESLIPGVVPAIVLMLVIMVGLFNALRPPLVIVLTIPFAMVGVIFGLLFTNTPFGFVALLGAMSLSGMMVKNSLVLLDEVNENLTRGLDRYHAVVEAAVSRLRPVVLAAATTVLGVIPLLQDVFWVGLAVTLMAGLSFGTLLTMILVPTLYATLFGISKNKTPVDAEPEPAPA